MLDVADDHRQRHVFDVRHHANEPLTILFVDHARENGFTDTGQRSDRRQAAFGSKRLRRDVATAKALPTRTRTGTSATPPRDLRSDRTLRARRKCVGQLARSDAERSEVSLRRCDAARRIVVDDAVERIDDALNLSDIASVSLFAYSISCAWSGPISEIAIGVGEPERSFNWSSRI